MDKRQLYIARVHEVCPDLSVESVTLDVEGQNNDILVVNDEVIFRFPKYDEGVKRLEIETAILNWNPTLSHYRTRAQRDICESGEYSRTGVYGLPHDPW